MDSMVSTAARALALGNPLAALKCIALRNDPPALALRGIAMAELGDYAKARNLLQRAERAFGRGEAVAQARCVTAQAEVALLSRDLAKAPRGLAAAAEVLTRHGDLANALFARLVVIRRLVLLGRLEQAQHALAELTLERAPARLVAVAELVVAEVATRQLQTRHAQQALYRARAAARAAGIPPLVREVEHALENLEAPAARLVVAGLAERPLRLAEVEELLSSGKLVVDACRREVRAAAGAVSLVRRPILFALAQTLAAQAPAEASRESLIWQAFGARRGNDSHRARLRVEIGRLRRALKELANVSATRGGFVLQPERGEQTALLLPPAADEASSLFALLADGDAWSTSALSAALGKSQRAVQRALAVMQDTGSVRAMGRGRAQRWVREPRTGFATTLLLVTQNNLG